jgi:hypothetical protein
MLTFIELDGRYLEKIGGAVEAFCKYWVDNTSTFHLGCSEFKSRFIDNCPGCLRGPTQKKRTVPVTLFI